MARLFASASTQYLKVSRAAVTAYPVTQVAWFNAVDQGTPQTLVCLSDDSVDTACQRIYVDESGGTYRTFAQSIEDGGGNEKAQINGWTPNVWQHLAGVFRSSTSRSIYLNGSSASNVNSVTFDAGMNATSIGFLDRLSPTQYMNGGLAQAALYNAWLSDTDIMRMVKKRLSPLLVRPQSLIAYWALRHGDNADWLGRFGMAAVNAPIDTVSPPIVYPERDDPVWGLVLPRYRPRRYWVVLKAPAGNPWYAYAQQ
jgi:hypothetical protein